MKVYCLHVWVLTEEKGVRFPRTEVTDSCKPPCGWRGPNLGPQQEKLVLLTPAVSPTPKLTIFDLPNLLSVEVSKSF